MGLTVVASSMHGWYTSWPTLSEKEVERQALRERLNKKIEAYSDAVFTYTKGTEVHPEALNLLHLMIKQPIMFTLRWLLHLMSFRLEKEGIVLDVEKELQVIREQLGQKLSLPQVAGMINSKVERTVQQTLRSLLPKHQAILEELDAGNGEYVFITEDGEHITDIEQMAQAIIEEQELKFGEITSLPDLSFYRHYGSDHVAGLDMNNDSISRTLSVNTINQIRSRYDMTKIPAAADFASRVQYSDALKRHKDLFSVVQKMLWSLEAVDRWPEIKGALQMRIPGLAMAELDPFLIADFLKNRAQYDRHQIYKRHVKDAVLFFLGRRIWDETNHLLYEMTSGEHGDPSELFEAMRPQFQKVEEALALLTVDQIEAETRKGQEAFFSRLREQLIPGESIREAASLLYTEGPFVARSFLTRKAAAIDRVVVIPNPEGGTFFVFATAA